MGEPAVAFLAVLIIVVGVLLTFGAIAFFGMRAAFHPPTPRKRRRVAHAVISFGIFSLGFHVGAVVYGAEIPRLSALVAIGLIASGLLILRDLRQNGTSKTSLC